jgi:aldehyde:ferredoxin oxidoreductase
MMAGGPLMKPNGLVEGVALPRKFKRAGDDRYEAEKLTVALGQVRNSLGLCEFIDFFQKYPLFELIKGATGWDLSVDDIMKIGMRIQSLRHAFSLREGVDIIKIKLPERAVGVDYLEEFKGFCQKFGWNPENGYPLKETLTDLNLDFVLKDLY